jgi:protoporphyrinogen oxidase
MAKRVGIVGGGPAGLGLAYALAKQGHEVSVFEAAPELGGLARSFALGDVRIERYYHFICKVDDEYFRTLAELGIAPSLRWTSTRMGFFHDGTLYPFNGAADLLRCKALAASGRVRCGALTAYCAARKDWQALDDLPARKWLIDFLGLDAYRVLWEPLLAVKFHEFHDRISAAWVWHRIHRVARSRGSLLARERFGYLEGGTDVLVNALVEQARARGARFHTSMPVRRIVHDGRKVEGIETRYGERHAFDCVVSAVPLPHFVRMTPDLPGAYRERLEAIDFIGVICVALRTRRRLSENFWLNVNDRRVPFNGFIEYTNLNPGVTGDGSHVVYVPYYLPRDHERFRLSDAETVDDAIASLSVVEPSFGKGDVIDAAVSRDPYAQVICSTGFRTRVPEHRTPIDGLYLVESSQLYPSDRTISGTLELAARVAGMVAGA